MERAVIADKKGNKSQKALDDIFFILAVALS